MIEVFEGRLGGGKTYHAVKRMVKYLASGGVVCSNIALKMDAVAAYLRTCYSWEYQEGQYIFLEDEKINQFYRHTPSGTPECPSLVVIDEAHIWLNARDWANVLREMLIFLTQSRKCFTDIIFISQSALNIDKQIMRLVQYVWRFRDLKKLKIAELGIGWPLNQFLVAQYDYDGKTLLDKKFELKDKQIYPLYNTHELLRKFPRLEGVQIKFDGKIKGGRRKKIMKLVLIVAFLVVMLWIGYQKIGSKIGLRKEKPVAVAQAVVVPSVAQSTVVKSVEKKNDIVLSERFLGIIEDEKGRTVITPEDRYVQGEFCRLGKVLFCYDDKILVSGFDRKPHMVLRDNSLLKPEKKNDEYIRPVEPETGKLKVYE